MLHAADIYKHTCTSGSSHSLDTCIMSCFHVFFFWWHNLLHGTPSFTLFHYKTPPDLDLHSPHQLNSSSMALKLSLPILAFFLLFTSTLAHHQQQQQQQQNQCDLRRIDALEPYNSIQAEAGVTEFWDSNNQQFQCTGVEFIRHRIQPGGLLLPSYVNTPLLAFIEQGTYVKIDFSILT